MPHEHSSLMSMPVGYQTRHLTAATSLRLVRRLSPPGSRPGSSAWFLIVEQLESQANDRICTYSSFEVNRVIKDYFIPMHTLNAYKVLKILGDQRPLVQLQGTSLGIAIPSPLWGEGEGEGNRMRFQPPSPPSSPASGRGGKSDSQRGWLFLH